jgi:hypothetical protein
MAYQQMQQLQQQQQQQQQGFDNSQQYASSNLDSITLGQLRSALPTPQKPKVNPRNDHAYISPVRVAILCL